MTKSKKERRRKESEDDDSSSSSSESTSSSSSDQSVAKKKSKKKKASAKKSKRQRKPSPSSSSSSDSDGDSSPERKKAAAKRPSNEFRELRPSRNDDKHQGHHQEQDNRRQRRDHFQNTSKWDSPNVEYSGGNRDHRNRQNWNDRRQGDQRRDNNFRRNWTQSNRDRDEHNRNWDRDWGDNKRHSDHDRQPDKRHDNRRDFQENRNDSRRDQDSRNNNNSNQNRRDFQDRRDDRERRRSRSPRRPRNFPRRRDDDNENYEWGKRETSSGKEEDAPAEKEKPNFGLSGKLTEDTNKVNGIVIKYAEPLEARKPKRRWRLYPFKGEKALSTLYIHRQSCYLIGRDRKVCDLPVDHPSCSKQHAALQYRLVPFTREDGTAGKRVRPYIIDLESANGTFLNNKPIESKKYFELIEKDVVKFGFSSREYVLLHENSKDDELDDDVIGDESDGGGGGAVEVKEEPTG